MTIRVYVFVCIAFTSLLNGAQARKGDGAPWGSYFSRGFGGIYSPDDFALDPRPLGRLEHRHRGRSHSLYESQADSHDDTQHTLGRGDLVQGHIPAVPDAQSRNVPYDSKQVWAQDTQLHMQHDWSQDFQDDTQQDFQDDTQQDFQDDSQHDADPQDFTGYPPAKGHHPPPDVFKHTTPIFHHTTYQPPVHHTSYQPEPTTQHTTYPTEPSVDHTPYQTQTPVYPTPYLTETTERYHTTEPSYHSTEYPTEKTTYGSYDTTKHPGLSDYEVTTHPSRNEEGVCRPNPAADGYPPGTKLICTVEIIICNPIKSQKGSVKNTGKTTTLTCKPFNGCEDTGYTTKTPEYTTNDHGYTTEHSGYTTEVSGHTTNGGYTTDSGQTTDGGYTTDGGQTTDGGYTTEKHDFTTEKQDYTTEKHGHTTEGGYITEHTTEKPEYPTTHPVTHKPVTTSERYSPKPTLPPQTTPRDEDTTPCVNKPGVKGRSRECGVKGGVKGGYRQTGWSNWSSWNPWSEWESKREGMRKHKQHTSWLPQTQPQRHETPRRPVWNGAWPSSWSAQGSAPAYVEF